MKTEQNISLYEKLVEIKAVTFHEIKFTGNVYLLDKDYKEGKEYSSDQIIKIKNTWIKLYDDYFEKSDNQRYRVELKSKHRTLDLLLRINALKQIITLLEYAELEKDYIPQKAYEDSVNAFSGFLSQLHKKIDASKPTKELIEIAKNVQKGLETKYKIQHQEEGDVKGKTIQDYYDLKATYEDALGRNLPEDMNMLQWISYGKRVMKKIKNG